MTNALRVGFLLCILFVGANRISAQHFSILRTKEGIEVCEGSSRVLFYQIRPRSLSGKFERSNYIHPLYSLDGVVLTEDFPDDHPHHHGIFWSWHQIIYKNQPIADGWTSENISWEVVRAEPDRRKSQVRLDNEVVWSVAIGSGRAEPIVREDSRIIVYKAATDYRILDFDIRLKPLVKDLKIGGSDDAKGYGGFSWRIRLPDDIKFINKEGEVMPQVTGVEAGPWLDFRGSLEGEGHQQSGIAVFCHPENPGHPQPWILRNKMSMQNLAFPGRHAVALPDAGLRLRYRMVIHNNEVGMDELEELYRAYEKK